MKLRADELRKLYGTETDDQAIVEHTSRLIRDVRYYRHSTGQESEAAQNRLRSWMITLAPRQVAITEHLFN